jgi:hypothetical protein
MPRFESIEPAEGVLPSYPGSLSGEQLYDTATAPAVSELTNGGVPVEAADAPPEIWQPAERRSIAWPDLPPEYFPHPRELCRADDGSFDFDSPDMPPTRLTSDLQRWSDRRRDVGLLEGQLSVARTPSVRSVIERNHTALREVARGVGVPLDRLRLPQLHDYRIFGDEKDFRQAVWNTHLHDTEAARRLWQSQGFYSPIAGIFWHGYGDHPLDKSGLLHEAVHSTAYAGRQPERDANGRLTGDQELIGGWIETAPDGHVGNHALTEFVTELTMNRAAVAARLRPNHTPVYDLVNTLGTQVIALTANESRMPPRLLASELIRETFTGDRVGLNRIRHTLGETATNTFLKLPASLEYDQAYDAVEEMGLGHQAAHAFYLYKKLGLSIDIIYWELDW